MYFIKHLLNWIYTTLIMVIYGFLISLALVKSASAEELTRNEIVKLIHNEAVNHNLDPQLVLSIAIVESNLIKNRRGLHGEVGIFQLHPKYHKISSTRNNIKTAIQYMVKLRVMCGVYKDAWFICYNLGPYYKRIKHPTKFAYYKKVMNVNNNMNVNWVVAKGDRK